MIRQTSNLGAKYPDIVAILQAAARQSNLPGPLVIDAVPGSSPVYVEAAIFGKDTTAKKDDAVKKTKLEKKKTRPAGGFFWPVDFAAASVNESGSRCPALGVPSAPKVLSPPALSAKTIPYILTNLQDWLELSS